MINGSIRLFRAFGIDVFLHWSWFLIAIFLIPRFGEGQFYGTGNQAMLWSTALYLALFGIVLIHEFGHALACRSVGGKARHIVLWPLGGVAFVQPPQRPGAHLWSIVAGPLVNVMLVPVTIIAYYLVRGSFDAPMQGSNLQAFFLMLMLMNAGLLVFNMLPIYPLDGGQTVMALLWFAIGRARALRYSSVIGLVAAGLFVMLAVAFFDVMLLLIALFLGLQAFNGYRVAAAMSRMDPKQFDERFIDKDVEDRIQSQIDPWRR